MRDIAAERREGGVPRLRRFHQARWDEPILFELGAAGERGVLVPRPEPAVRRAAPDATRLVPASLRRRRPPALPEISQNRVLRHFLRLSQENLGADLNVDVGQGTCTMKYSPKVNDRLARLPQIAELHPCQDEGTVQGILEIFWRFEQILKELSGLDRFSLQPASGSQAIYANAAIIRAYHASRGEAAQRREIITTVFSHPSNAACAKTAGFHVVTLPPGPEGYPELQALRAALSERTAGLMITNPEDTGIFNPGIREFTDAVHGVGGLCAYDQANANGILGVTRAREAGFDVCHFNLHKTFSTPHGCGGPAGGAIGVTRRLEPFLPVPLVVWDGRRYRLDYDRPRSIGKVRSWYGVAPVILRAYAWAMSLGAEGLAAVSRQAVLANNYLMKKILEIPGVRAPYAEGRRRVEQVRYSWESLCRETGVHSEDLGLRAADYGVHYWTSHHPHIVAEPCTLEPTESYSKADLDEYAAILRAVAAEARADPGRVRTAPHNSTVHRVDPRALDDPGRWAVTWRAYRRKILEAGAPGASPSAGRA